jgi:hypothetical protein
MTDKFDGCGENTDFGGGAFEVCAGALWRRTRDGAYARYTWGRGRAPTAVIFRSRGGWRGASNKFDEPRFTRECSDTPEQAIRRLVEAEEEGPESKLWAAPRTSEWTSMAPIGGRAGYWRNNKGVMLTVREGPPILPDPQDWRRYDPAWFAAVDGEAMGGADGRPWGFPDADTAMWAADGACESRAAARRQAEARKAEAGDAAGR